MAMTMVITLSKRAHGPVLQLHRAGSLLLAMPERKLKQSVV